MTPDDPLVLADLRRSVRAISLLMLPATALATGAATFALIDAPDPPTRWSVAVGMAVLVYVGGQQKLWANYLRGFGQVRLASLLEGRSGGAIASACQGLLLGLVLLVRPGWGLPGALGALAVGYAIPVVVAWSRVHRIWRHVDARGSIWRDLVTAVRRYWRFASNLLGGYLNSTVEIWLAAFVLTAAQVSQFSAAQRLSVLLSVPLVSLGVVFSPVVSRLVDHDDGRLEKLLRTGATAAIGITAVAWIPMLVAPGWLLGVVYGEGFAGAAPILVLLTFGSFANVWSGMCGTALTMSRHESVVATVQWVAVVLRIVVGSATAMLFGMAGLGASAASITVIVYLALWVTTRRRMGLWTHPTLRPSLRLMRQTQG
ncbi:MAG: lipopolysaccharide biosynthesis protein [Sporichthyaceae bacterium]|nr:lipopolysaccharide biosynthesis protein [Sporichthyaceae bacterium]